MKKIAMMFIMALCTLSVWSQSRALGVEADTLRSLRHYKGGDNWFIGAGGGINIFWNEGMDYDNLRIAPSIDANLGKWFTPSVGYFPFISTYSPSTVSERNTRI